MAGLKRFEATREMANPVQLIAQGNEVGIAALYDEYAEPVFRFIYRRMDERHEEAEEVLQDTFVSAVTLAKTFDGSCAVQTWLCGIAKLRIVDFYRREGRDKRVPREMVDSLNDDAVRDRYEPDCPETSVEDALDRLSAAQLVDRMLASLSDDECEALLLRYVEQFSVREIAHMLHRSEKAIEGLLDRAKKKATKAGAQWV